MRFLKSMLNVIVFVIAVPFLVAAAVFDVLFLHQAEKEFKKKRQST